MALSLTPGQGADIIEAEPFLDEVDPKAFIADKAYDADRECPEVCVSVLAHAFSDTQAAKRSPNIMANWLRAANHSRTFLPSFSKLSDVKNTVAMLPLNSTYFLTIAVRRL